MRRPEYFKEDAMKADACYPAIPPGIGSGAHFPDVIGVILPDAKNASHRERVAAPTETGDTPTDVLHAVLEKLNINPGQIELDDGFEEVGCGHWVIPVSIGGDQD